MYKFNIFDSPHYGYWEYTFIEEGGNGVMIFMINTNSLKINIRNVIVNPNCPAIIADLFNQLDDWVKEHQPEMKEIKLVTDDRDVIMILLDRGWKRDEGEEASTMTYKVHRDYHDTFGSLIEVGDNVVFILNGNTPAKLAYGTITNIDTRYIYIRNDADGKEYLHLGVPGDDPAIQVRDLREA